MYSLVSECLAQYIVGEIHFYCAVAYRSSMWLCGGLCTHSAIGGHLGHSQVGQVHNFAVNF